MTAVAFEHVSKRYGSRAILEDLVLEIPRGKTSVLLGPSGTGKSTLLRIATGLLTPDAGVVRVLGEEVCRDGRRSLPPRALIKLRRRMGMLFQENALFGSLCVGDNVAFPLRRVAGLSQRAARAKASEMLALVGLVDVDGRMPDALSGGQRKRVALARALALEPELVLFDEPTSGLDPQTSAAIDALISQMQARLQATFVVITHDTTSAGLIGHHVGFLLQGRLHVWGSRDEVWASSDPLLRAFLDRKPPSG